MLSWKIETFPTILEYDFNFKKKVILEKHMRMLASTD